jgi:hypothetical protein
MKNKTHIVAVFAIGVVSASWGASSDPHGLGRNQSTRTLAWLHQFRRLNMRYKRRASVHEGLLMLAWSLICWNFLKPVTYF